MGKKRNLSAAMRRELQQTQIRNRQELREVLRRDNKESRRSFTRWIEEFYAGRALDETFRDSRLVLLRDLFRGLSSRQREPERQCLRDMLLHLERQNCRRLLEDEQMLAALGRVVGRRRHFHRDPAGWRRQSHNVQTQFRGLVRHCFAEYRVPGFMDKCWFSDFDEIQQYWFIRIGQGSSLRKFNDLPLRATKRMLHFFLEAPDDFTIEQALRWSQVRGMGGSDSLARVILGSLIGRNNFENETFWEGVIRFFVQNPAGMALDSLHGIVDYLARMREEDPDYSIKGRTIASLTRQSAEWHRDMLREAGRGGRFIWPTSGIAEFVRTEGKDESMKTYRLHELLSSRELNREGRNMQHCVWSYARACQSGRTTIFSLRETDSCGESRTLATIEVFLGHRGHPPVIVQAKARQNRPVCSKARMLIDEWARAEKIQLRVR